MTIKMLECPRCRTRFNISNNNGFCNFCATRLEEVTIMNVGGFDNDNGNGLFENIKMEIRNATEEIKAEMRNAIKELKGFELEGANNGH